MRDANQPPSFRVNPIDAKNCFPSRPALWLLAIIIGISGVLILPNLAVSADSKKSAQAKKKATTRQPEAKKESYGESPRSTAAGIKPKQAEPIPTGQVTEGGFTTVHPVQTATYNPQAGDEKLSLERLKAAQAGMNPGVAKEAMPKVPEGPFITRQSNTPLQETSPAQPTAPPAIQVSTNTSLSGVPFTTSYLSAISEPAVAENGTNVFYTANWFAAYSTNSGSSFTHRDPFTYFPTIHGGFCCDQDAIYASTHGLFLWYLQYINNGTGNVGRLAWTTNPSGAWNYIDIKPEDVGAPFIDSDWYDYPHISLSNNYVYFASNVFTSGNAFRGSQIVRVPLSELVTPPGGGVTTARFVLSGGAMYSPVMGATSTLYFFRHNSTSQMRVYTWADGAAASAVTSNDVNHASFISSGYSCPDTSGFNMCASLDSRLQAGWVAGGKIGMMWNTAQGADGLGTFTYPYVRVLVLNESNKTIDSEFGIFSSSFAYMSPSVAPNSAGNLGGTINWGGNATLPTLGVFVSDSLSGTAPTAINPLQLQSVATGTHFTSRNRWGDYARTRRNNTITTRWTGTGYVLNGGNTNGFAQPRFLNFGRQPTATNLSNSAASSMKATGYDNGAFIEWQTGFEMDNLGFNIYRDDNGKRVRLNSDLIAGSALAAGQSTSLTAGKAYSWWDKTSGGKYWIEEIDLKGFTKSYAVTAQRGAGAPARQSRADALSRLGYTQRGVTQLVETMSATNSRTASPASSRNDWATQPSVKIAINQSGYYRVTQAELLGAGLRPDVDPRNLQLYVDGQEQAIMVKGEEDGKLDGGDTLEFYAVALQTPATDTRVYWLVESKQPGKRIAQIQAAAKAGAAGSFACTVERKDRTIYFSALKNGDKENFFGAVVARTPVDQTLTLQHVDTASRSTANLEVTLQGVSQSQHSVGVQFNGLAVGSLSFTGQTSGSAALKFPASLVREGENTVRLTAQGGDSDVSLVDSLRLTYAHTYIADNEALRFTATGGAEINLNGFSTPQVRLFDISDANSPQEVKATIVPDRTGYAVIFKVQGDGQRTLYAVSDKQTKTALAITGNRPSNLRQTNNAADLLILAPSNFMSSIEPLKTLRQSQGFATLSIDVEDIYDEFNFGQKSPQAIKDFLAYAKNNWQRQPRYILFVGDSSFDPKNYLGFGNHDYLPTKLLDTFYIESASDDWFADFDNDGLAEMSIGRLPVRTADEARAVVSKLINYESSRPANQVLLVADANDTYDFENATAQLRDIIGNRAGVEQINRSQGDDATARSRILEAINSGKRVVNFTGHGNIQGWRGNLLTADDSSALQNRQSLSLFIMMTCLNGYFQDIGGDSLAESLLKSSGGAVAVWASSALTEPSGQSLMNQQAFNLLFNEAYDRAMTLGELTLRAKEIVGDGDLRKTWILIGDPTMRLR